MAYENKIFYILYMKTFRRKSSGRKTRGRKTRGRKTRGGNKMIQGGFNFIVPFVTSAALNGHLGTLIKKFGQRNIVQMDGNGIIGLMKERIQSSEPHSHSGMFANDNKKAMKHYQEIIDEIISNGQDKMYKFDIKEHKNIKLYELPSEITTGDLHGF
jgi:hypothetical protein